MLRANGFLVDARKTRCGLLALGAVALLVAGCSQTTASAAGNMVGTHDVALLDRYLFVTSTDKNELRVIDLAPPGAVGRRFVMAPNPLETLSVPVLDRPTMVLADAWYDTVGVRTTGRYVYATRQGAREISVVDATRPTGDEATKAVSSDVHFRELRRIPLPGPLTALAASHDLVGNQSQLYVATYDGQRGTLLRLDLPEVPSDLAALTEAGLRARMKVLAATPGEPISALLAVPGLPKRTESGRPFCDSVEECVVLATRRSAGLAGRTMMLEPSSMRTAALTFPGPVRFLGTAGSFTRLAEAGVALATNFGPGQRVFAILDEERCGSPDCGGVIAVDTLTAAGGGFPVASDFSGTPMIPITVGAGLLTGLSLQPGGTLLLGAALLGVAEARAFPLLGVATSSNGDLLFFDAARLKHLDTDPGPAAVSSTSFVDASGAAATWVDGPIATATDASGNPVSAVTLADGAWRSQDLVVVWQGTIPGLAGLETSASEGSHLALPASLHDRVQVGDLVVFANPSGVCGETTVTALQAASLDVTAAPGTCADRSLFSIRAGPQLPYVVTSSSAGYLGRAAPGGVLERHDSASSFAHLAGYDPAAPTLRLTFAPSTPAVGRDATWVLSIDAHFAPFVVFIEYTGTNCRLPMVLPGTPVYDPPRDVIFVAYPSTNAVAEVHPKLVTRGAITSVQSTICLQ